MKAMSCGRVLVGASFLVVLAGCVTQATIDPNSFARPGSAVIVDIPKLNNVAVVGIIVPWAPDFPGFHFSPKADYYFAAGAGQARPAR